MKDPFIFQFKIDLKRIISNYHYMIIVHDMIMMETKYYKALTFL
jgi:hypothetical protein